MIPKITIKHNFPEVAKLQAQLEEEVRVQATARAINRTLDQGKTRMIRAITAEYNIKAGVVRESLRIISASAKQGYFRIEGILESPAQRGRSRNLIHFGAKQTPLGVMVQIKRNGPRKVIRGAFIANKSNQYGGTVFERRGKSRLPIDSIQSIGVPQMFNAKKVNEQVVRFLIDKFPEVFEREARYYTERFNRRRATL